MNKNFAAAMYIALITIVFGILLYVFPEQKNTQLMFEEPKAAKPASAPPGKLFFRESNRPGIQSLLEKEAAYKGDRLK